MRKDDRLLPLSWKLKICRHLSSPCRHLSSCRLLLGRENVFLSLSFFLPQTPSALQALCFCIIPSREVTSSFNSPLSQHTLWFCAQAGAPGDGSRWSEQTPPVNFEPEEIPPVSSILPDPQGHCQASVPMAG